MKSVKYELISPRRQEFIDKVQLLAASLGIFTGYADSLHIYKGVAILLPIVGYAVVLLNLLFVFFYKKIIKRLNYKFEALLLRLNGVMILATALGYQLTGSQYLQYVYYVVALIYLFVLPMIVLPVKNKRILRLTPSELLVNKRFKTVSYLWQNMDWVRLDKFVLKIRENGKRKSFFLVQDADQYNLLSDFIKDIEQKYDIQVSD